MANILIIIEHFIILMVIIMLKCVILEITINIGFRFTVIITIMKDFNLCKHFENFTKVDNN